MAEPEPIVRLACRAMNTRFEVALWGRDQDYLTAVAEEALREIQALDTQLSFYRDDSDIRMLNVVAAHRPVTVEPRLFQLLQRAQELSTATDSAFDPAVAPLLQAWGFTGEGGRIPSSDALEEARQISGMHLMELDPEAFTASFACEGAMLDLGAIGKGYAIERASQLVQDYEVPGALLHGGTSTVYAVGKQPDGSEWQIALRDPTTPDGTLLAVPLRDQALSVSGSHGKSFTLAGEHYGHVLDPREGRPVRGVLLAAVRCASATDSDALSTALLVRGAAFFPQLREIAPEASALVLEQGENGETHVKSYGL
ncbi:MAG: FAD:protein FMN transferase [Actinomycetota bacterium]